jgi:hypothetical protein
VILFERHIFHRRTQGRFAAQAPDLSNAKAGGYGPDGINQHEKLARAVALDRRAALESASWGLGQVMGFNAVSAGFADVEAMVAAMCAGEDAQFASMVGYIAGNGLGPLLKRHDWDEFAYHYNGSDYRKNGYDAKLARCFARYQAGPLPDLRIRAAQLYLSYLGYPCGGVDGWYGANTQKALIRFQTDHGLEPAGALDDSSFAALEQAVHPG